MLKLKSNSLSFLKAIMAASCGMLLLAISSLPAAAQDSTAVQVNVGIAAAKPGDPIDIPLTLSGNENATLGGLLMHVDFPKKLLAFTESERGLAVELADGEVKVAASDDKNDATQTVLEISIASKTPVKPGILGYLKFNVSADAQKGVIVLKVLDTKATAAGGGNMELAKGDDGQLTIFALDETIPVVGCFFFTH